jgi:SAM-dependent methyltransferase
MSHAAGSEAPHVSPYVLKSQPHSSHNIVLRLLREAGGGSRLLDLGCADGYLSRLFLVHGFSVTAIDAPTVSRHTIPAGADFLEADLDLGLPPLEGEFDFVICADVLEHLHHPERLLRQARAKMSPSGLLIASLPNSGNIYFRLTVLLGRFPSHERGLFDSTHLHFYTWDGWTQLLRRTGFRIARVESSVIPFSLVLPRLPRLAAALESLYAMAARIWKALFAYQFVVIASPDSQE